MGVKQCDKCGEMVDEAKAFCPGCGNAFVAEEIRSDVSNFDTFEGTVKLGQTMYNQMLSDMGLNISKTPDSEETVKPVAPEPVIARPAAVAPRVTGKPDRTKWIIVGGAAVIIVLILVLAAIILAVMFFERMA